MSKATNKAIEQIVASLRQGAGAEEIPAVAIGTLIGEGLGFLERIAIALEKPSIAAMGEGMVVGEIAKFEPAIDPALVERAVKALEELALRHGMHGVPL